MHSPFEYTLVFEHLNMHEHNIGQCMNIIYDLPYILFNTNVLSVCTYMYFKMDLVQPLLCKYLIVKFG